MAPPGGQPVYTITAPGMPLPGLGPVTPVAAPVIPIAPPVAPFTRAPVPAPTAQYLPPLDPRAFTLSLGVPRVAVGLLAAHAQIAAPMMPHALAAAHQQDYDVAQLVQQSLATRTMPQMRAALLQLIDEDPLLMRRVAESKIDLARLHGASFLLTIASFLGAAQLVEFCGITDPNAQLALIVGVAHAAEPVIGTVANVAMHRLTAAPIRIGGALVSYLELTEAHGAAQLTVVYRGATQRAIWQAMMQRFFPEGTSVVAQLGRGVWGIGTAVVRAPFGGGAVAGVGFGLAHWMGEAMEALGLEGWGCHIASAVALLGPAALDAATASGAAAGASGARRGVVTRLLDTPVGRLAAGLGYLYSASFALSCVEWGINRITHGGDDYMAYAGRAHEIGELVYANGLPWLFRKIGLGGMSDAIAAGDIPSLLDPLDRVRVALGWMEESQTAVAIRARVDAKNRRVTLLTAKAVRTQLRMLYRDLDGCDTPAGLLDGLLNGWLDTVRHPSLLQYYHVLADRRLLIQPLVDVGLMTLPDDMASPVLVPLGDLYQQLRYLYQHRIYDPRTAGLVSAFAGEFLEWHPQAEALPDRMPILVDPEQLLTSIGGAERLLHERRQYFYAVLARILALMATENLNLDDLRGWAQLAAAQPDQANELPAPIAMAGRDVEATIALIEWARTHGYLDADDQIRPTPDYYAMLGTTGMHWPAVVPAERDAWQQWVVEEAATIQSLLVQREPLWREAVRHHIDGIKLINPSALFVDDPETVVALDRLLARAAREIKPRLSVGWEALRNPDRPEGPADAALQASARKMLDEAREVLAREVEVQVGGQPGLLAFHAAADPFVWTAMYNGLFLSTRSALADVVPWLRVAVRNDPILAVRYPLDPETGLPRSAAALRSLLLPTLQARDRAEGELIRD